MALVGLALAAGGFVVFSSARRKEEEANVLSGWASRL